MATLKSVRSVRIPQSFAARLSIPPDLRTAAENLVSFSQSDPAIFKTHALTPVKDLKLLVNDYAPIANNVLTILINISSDPQVLSSLAEDDSFLETLLLRVTNAQEPNGDGLAMLLANLAKSPSMERLIPLQRRAVPALSTSSRAIAQLLELYNVGAIGKYNKKANFDYLAYIFADLAKYTSFQIYLTTPPAKSPLDPLTILLPFTAHASAIRRLGTATTLRNLALGHPDPLYLLQPSLSILPPLLLPLCSSDQSGITPEEMETLPEECQFLTAEEHTAERDPTILGLLLETLYLLVARSGAEGRDLVRGKGAYAVVRELHLRIEDEDVRRACEKIVDVLMVGHGEASVDAKTESPGDSAAQKGRVQELEGEEEGDEENEITPIF